ncbi:MAG: hypothetical protein R3C18_22860 [Planctomycetaceae bacterium]
MLLLLGRCTLLLEVRDEELDWRLLELETGRLLDELDCVRVEEPEVRELELTERLDDDPEERELDELLERELLLGETERLEVDRLLPELFPGNPANKGFTSARDRMAVANRFLRRIIVLLRVEVFIRANP